MENRYWVYYHRHVVSVRENRWITKREHVHHIDNDTHNNSPCNLQLLTASEHATEHNPFKVFVSHICPGCGKKIERIGFAASKLKYCGKECFDKHHKKIVWPSPEDLQVMLWKKPTSTISKELGVSDNAVGKFAKKHKLTKPPRGYWAKQQFSTDDGEIGSTHMV